MIRGQRIKKGVWAWGGMAVAGLIALKAHKDYSDSDDAYADADDAYNKYSSSVDFLEIERLKILTQQKKSEGDAKLSDGKRAGLLGLATLGFSLYHFFSMPPYEDYNDEVVLRPELNNNVFSLNLKKRF